MIITEGLTKEFQSNGKKIVAVDDLTIRIEGGIVGLLGPNGAGKTTTIRMLSTIYRPTKGGAIVAGHDIISDSLKVRASIGLATETPSLYPRLTARKNLEYFAALFDVDKSERGEIIDGYLEKFGLLESADVKIDKYSKGMKQKLSLIKALLHGPRVLMLDEPWSGLSPDAARDVRNLIKDLKDENRTVLISTHNLAQAEQVVDRLLIINKGKLVEDATPAKLRLAHAVKPIVRLKIDDYSGLEDKLSTLDYFDHLDSSRNDSIDVHISSFDNTPDLVSHLVGAGSRIHSVSEVIPSLEEIYLELIEGGSK